MPYTVEDYTRELEEKVLEKASIKARLRGLTLAERLQGLTPEELSLALEEWVKSLTPEERALLRRNLEQMDSGQP